MKKFFSGCGVFFNNNYLELEERRLDVMFKTSIPDSEMRVNFCLFLEFMEFLLQQAYYNISCPISSCSCTCEGDSLWFMVTITTEDDENNILPYIRNHSVIKFEKEDGDILI